VSHRQQVAVKNLECAKIDKAEIKHSRTARRGDDPIVSPSELSPF
jgi:hypothetical protein